MFDWEHRIALHTMQGNQVSSCGKGEVSWLFSSCGGSLGYILELRRGCSFKACICSSMLGLLSSYDKNLRNLLEAWQGNMDAS